MKLSKPVTHRFWAEGRGFFVFEAMKRAMGRLIPLFLILAPLAPGTLTAKEMEWVPRIGYLSTGSALNQSHRIKAFRQALGEIGYVEGKNVLVEYRWAEGRTERLPELAAELADSHVNVIVAPGSQALLAAQQVTRTVPIIAAVSGEPLETEFVANLRRPHRNVTGLTLLAQDFYREQLELLSRYARNVSRVAVLWSPRSSVWTPQEVLQQELKSTAESSGVQVRLFEVGSPEKLTRIFRAAGRSRVDALITLPSPFMDSHLPRIVDFAARDRLLAMYPERSWAEAGGLIGYGPSYTDLFRRAVAYMDRVLKGVRPGDLPVVQLAHFNLVINLKTAKKIGLSVPPELLSHADELIQ